MCLNCSLQLLYPVIWKNPGCSILAMSTFAAYKSKILSELLRCAPNGFNSRFVAIFVPKLRVISSRFAHGLLSHYCCGNWFRASICIKYLKIWAEKILTLDGFQVETSEFSSVHNFSFTVSVWISCMLKTWTNVQSIWLNTWLPDCVWRILS